MPNLLKSAALDKELRFPLSNPAGQNITAVSAETAKRVQEWLTLHGYGLVIDGEPGPATRSALTRFASHAGGHVGGVLDEATWTLLVAPLWRAFIVPEVKEGRNLRAVVRMLAGQHLTQNPHEVGGDNRGPWVRAYCQGRDGKDYRWCAGFVSTILAQAVQSLGIFSPMGYSLDCDQLEEDARNGKRLTEDPSKVKPGDIFLCMRKNDAYHTGIVTSITSESFGTIEGNTNDEGSPNGYEVCARFRDFRNKRFITLG